MRRTTLTLALLLCLAGRAPAQSVMDRLAAVEANTAAINNRLSSLESKLDALAAKVDALAKPKATGPESWKPAGEGWQYDATTDSWWRYARQPQSAPTYYAQSYQQPVFYQQPMMFSAPFTGGACAGGSCGPTTAGFGRFRR